MRISTKELRTHTQELFDCLARGQTVTLTYRGKDRGVISGIEPVTQPHTQNFPVFGMWNDRSDDLDVDVYVRDLRKGRF